MKLYKNFTFLRTDKIQMIKLFRENFGLDLREAKECVESICADNKLPQLLEVIIPSFHRAAPGELPVPEDYKSYKWLIEIRDVNDEYTADRVAYTGTATGADEEAKFYTKQNPGCPVLLFKGQAMYKTADIVKTVF